MTEWSGVTPDNPNGSNSGGAGYNSPASQAGPNTTPWIVVAILQIICCNPFFGVPGLIFALQANSATKLGDIAAAEGKAKVAKIILGIGIAAAIVAWLIVIALFVVSRGNSDNPNTTDTTSITTTTGNTTSTTRANNQPQGSTTTPAQVPDEYRSALRKAETYAVLMNMSRDGTYDQLTSTAERFSPAAAQYAIDNVRADWKANALNKARQYQETTNLSRSAIYNQLTSDTGEKFTREEADYAMANL